jgi:hypothetical protein
MKKIINKVIQNEKGSALLWTMMFLAIFLLISSTVAVITIAEIRQSSKIDSSTEAYLLAEVGAERAKNFINAGKETDGQQTGEMSDKGHSYTFEVVKVTGTTKQYDNPLRDCIALDTNDDDSINADDTNYCYYSEATAGSIKRKIDGEKEDIPIDQGKSFLQGLPADTLSGNMLDLTPESGVITSPKKFYLRWQVDNIDLPSSSCTTSSNISNPCFAFGLFDLGVGSIDANLKKSDSSADTAVYLTGNTPATQNYTETADNTIYIPDSSTTAYFEMTYYVGGASILKVSDQGGECLGVLVRYNLFDQWNGSKLENPYNMFFTKDNNGSGPTVRPDGFGIDLTSFDKTIIVKNIFFKVE